MGDKQKKLFRTRGDAAIAAMKEIWEKPLSQRERGEWFSFLYETLDGDGRRGYGFTTPSLGGRYKIEPQTFIELLGSVPGTVVGVTHNHIRSYPGTPRFGLSGQNIVKPEGGDIWLAIHRTQQSGVETAVYGLMSDGTILGFVPGPKPGAGPHKPTDYGKIWKKSAPKTVGDPANGGGAKPPSEDTGGSASSGQPREGGRDPDPLDRGGYGSTPNEGAKAQTSSAKTPTSPVTVVVVPQTTTMTMKKVSDTTETTADGKRRRTIVYAPDPKTVESKPKEQSEDTDTGTGTGTDTGTDGDGEPDESGEDHDAGGRDESDDGRSGAPPEDYLFVPTIEQKIARADARNRPLAPVIVPGGHGPTDVWTPFPRATSAGGMAPESQTYVDAEAADVQQGPTGFGRIQGGGGSGGPIYYTDDSYSSGIADAMGFARLYYAQRVATRVNYARLASRLNARKVR
jgi:hypothetical protein